MFVLLESDYKINNMTTKRVAEELSFGDDVLLCICFYSHLCNGLDKFKQSVAEVEH